jgi:long-chain acyl-CoA synthetase
VNQILVLGDKHKYIAALIVPSMDKVRAFASAKGLPAGDPETVLRHPALVEEIQRHVDECCKGLAPFERVKRFALVGREFTIDEGEMTPTLKLRRRQIVERFADTIKDLYDDEDKISAEDTGARMSHAVQGASA